MAKIDVISGFLGAGKTTLIRKLIKDVYAGQKIVLVENEFGQIGIDGPFLQEAGITITEINSGCICCTLKGDFEAALKKVIDEFDPDHVIIEPSGVGKLSDIIKAINDVSGAKLNSYSTVVDAKRCAMYHRNFKEFFDDQIKTAACVILSRTQLINEETLTETVDIVRSLNPDARVITTPWDELSSRAIVDAMEGSSSSFPDDLDEEDEHEHHHHDEEGEHGHHHHDEDEEHEHHHHDEEDEEARANAGLSQGNRIYMGEGEHEHHHHHHEHDADEVFTSVGIETVNKYSAEEIKTALSKLPETVIRAKGIVPSKESGWLFFDYVPGDIDIRAGSAAYTGLITIIGEEVDIDLIKEIFGVH